MYSTNTEISFLSLEVTPVSQLTHPVSGKLVDSWIWDTTVYSQCDHQSTVAATTLCKKDKEAPEDFLPVRRHSLSYHLADFGNDLLL